MTTAAALITQLVQPEATDRATRSIRYQMHVARFPMHRDLAGFDFEQAKVDRRQILGSASTTFTEQAENLVLIGGTGTGKTHLATALGIEAVTHYNKRVRFYPTVELVNTLEQEKAGGRAGRLAYQLMHLDLVILDELGTCRFRNRAARCSFTCCLSSTSTPASSRRTWSSPNGRASSWTRR